MLFAPCLPIHAEAERIPRPADREHAADHRERPCGPFQERPRPRDAFHATRRGIELERQCRVPF
jgi:hypothetical protein